MAEKYKELQATKEKIQKSIEVKKEHLASLQPGLNAIMQVPQLYECHSKEVLYLNTFLEMQNIHLVMCRVIVCDIKSLTYQFMVFMLSPFSQASLPVQQYLSMPYEQTQKQTEVARHLPPPLYVLFVQANAYGQACGRQL